jgi:restriction endonuclease S subunit
LSSPFNEQKYESLLEGLRINEVLITKCLQQNDCRLESDFWTQQNTTQFETIKGSEIIEFVQYGTSKELNEEKEGYPILRLNEFNSRFIGTPSKYCNLISKEDYENLKLKHGDVLICRTNGNPNLVGKCALVIEDIEFAYASYLFKIRPKTEIINSATLVAFLSCKYGRKEIDKYSMTSNQTNFSPAKFREIDIPLFSKSFNNKIENLYLTSYKNLKDSERIYHQAEELLLETIGLKDFKPSQEGKNIKSFKESFLSTGRLDAEYYQPKYEETIEKIKTQPYELLGNLVQIKKSIEPGSDVYDDEGLPFLRVADYNKFGISDPDKKLANSFCKTNQELIENLKPKKETILFTKDGSVGNAYMLREDVNFITSGAVLHLTVKNKKQILPEYLTLVLNSELVQMQAERDSGGSIILHWRVDEIKNVVVPVVDYKIQQQIAELIEESFCLRRESERLLEEAKEKVEKEIETIK